MHKKEWARRFKGVLAVTAVAFYSFLSRPVLADDYNACKYIEASKRVEYTVNSKTSSASVSDVVGRFGKPIEVSCSEKYTVLLLERAIVRVAGGKRVLNTGESTIIDEPTGRIKVADFMEYDGLFGPECAKKGKVMWGKVAVVITESGQLQVYKGLQGKSIAHVQTSINLNEFNPSILQINISGSEYDTTVELKAGKNTFKVRIIGVVKDQIKIIEN